MQENKPKYVPHEAWQQYLKMKNIYSTRDWGKVSDAYFHCANKLLSREAAKLWEQLPDTNAQFFIEDVSVSYTDLLGLMELDQIIKEKNSLKNTRKPILNAIDKLCGLLNDLDYLAEAQYFIEKEGIVPSLKTLQSMIENPENKPHLKAIPDGDSVNYVLRLSRQRNNRHLDFMRSLAFILIGETNGQYKDSSTRKKISDLTYATAQIIFDKDSDFPSYTDNELPSKLFDIELMEKISLESQF